MRAEEILAIVGPADETLIAEIARTGATPEELGQAWAWVHADDALIEAGRPFPSGRVAQLVDLLRPPPDPDD